MRGVEPAGRVDGAGAGRMVKPYRGDVMAGISVALVLVPQSMAYAKIAVVDPVYGEQ